MRMERVSEENGGLYRAVRLRALASDPMAFGATYAEESRFGEAQWREKLARWDGVRGVGFVAMEGAVACGMAGGVLEEDGARAELVSMWVAPEWRRSGVGRELVGTVLDWLVGRGVREVRLFVTSVNSGAVRFYEGLGFRRSGRVEDYPNAVGVVEWEMVLGIGN